MRSARSRLGQKGEIIAAAELGKLGYLILDSNYRTRYGEIDLIAKDGEYLVFVEVRSLSSDAFCNPIETIDQRKVSRIIRTARHYLSDKNLNDCAIRFDIVEILHSKTAPPKPTVTKNAFGM